MIYVNLSGFLTSDEAGAVGKETESNDTMLLEIAAEHEERICLIELGVSL